MIIIKWAIYMAALLSTAANLQAVEPVSTPGAWWSTYFGSDKGAPWQERPGVLPIRFDAGGRIQTGNTPP